MHPFELACSQIQREAPALACEPLDQSLTQLGMGRSRSFPLPQWRAFDRYRTVFFDQGQGPALVFVHGLGGNATHWELIAPALADRYRVIGLDLVGCGWSRKPDGPFSLKLLREHLLSFLDSLSVERATLVGHSLGGAVCLSAALAQPQRCQGLALLCAAGVAPVPAWMRSAAPIFLRRWLLVPTLVLGANYIVRNVFVDSAAQSEHVRWFRRAAMRDGLLLPNLREFARVCESLCWDVAQSDFSDQLAQLELPILGIWGEQDKLTTVPAVLELLRAHPRARVATLERCGHMPMIERPQETLQLLQEFLSSYPS